jgi:catechol 2,3-dioxygenase-like lactoylglutathione lyase family enzyme
LASPEPLAGGVGIVGSVLLDGINHVAILTSDTERLQAFYREVFEAEVGGEVEAGPGMRLSFVHIGPHTELNVFELRDGAPLDRSVMFGRGPIDHLGLHAPSRDAFDEIRRRLMACGATDGFVTDFGPVLSLFFRDPDGLECEVLMTNPDAVPGVNNPPGTPAKGY